jgi:hypothetical protein
MMHSDIINGRRHPPRKGKGEPVYRTRKHILDRRSGSIERNLVRMGGFEPPGAKKSG